MQTFYISETTLTNDIDELNKYTAYVNVKIKYSNKKGFYIEGDEYYIRNCALRLHYDSSMVKSIRREKREIKDNIVSWISEVLYKEEIAINKNSLDALTNYITRSAGNIIAGRTITSLSLIDNIEYTKDFINIAQKIYKELSQRLKINFSDEETAFLAYFLRGVLDLKNVQLSKNDPLYQKAVETIHLTNFIFNNIGINIRLNIDDDQLLRFFYGFFIRLKLDIQKREMIYLDIETTYPKSYLLSKIIFKEIAKLQNQIVAKEEAAYFSIILENLYLRQKYNSKKYYQYYSPKNTLPIFINMNSGISSTTT